MTRKEKDAARVREGRKEKEIPVLCPVNCRLLRLDLANCHMQQALNY